ncbi:MAG: hypothetical protein M3115_07370 [Thermoproteota archaeon]|nr:hypothetical protein [Thermoproteota archaeon]
MEKIESSTGLGEAGSYLQLLIYRVPKKDHDAIVQNLKQSVPWFNKHEVRIEYFQLGNTETQGAVDSAKQSGIQGMDSIESLAKTLSVGEEDNEEEIWIEQHYFRDYKHCEDVNAKMMQDKSFEPLLKEFFGLITQGTSLIVGGFRRIK